MYAACLVGFLVQPPAELPAAEHRPDFVVMTQAEATLFDRLRPHIDRRVEQRMLAALDPPVEGIGGGAFLVKLGEVVERLVKRALELLVLGVVVSLMWKYVLYLIAGAGGVPALVAAAVAWFYSRPKE